MTPARLAWWSRVLRVDVPIKDEGDLRLRLGALGFLLFMLIAMAPFVYVTALFVCDVGAWAVSPSPLEARVHALETQVAEMRDGGRR